MLTINERRDPKDLISISAHQNTQTFSPPIDPFAIDIVSFDCLSIENIAALTRLGRSGPREVYFCNPDGILDCTGNESCERFKALIARSDWIEWKRTGRYWFALDRSLLTSEEMVAEENLSLWVKEHNVHITELQDSTRTAAVTLLHGARPLLCSRPCPLPDHPKITRIAHNVLASTNQLVNQSLSATSFPSINTSNASSPLHPAFPILSLPYEILDCILYHLSRGCLSTNQHRIVMNYAEDRSTLGVNSAESTSDFLRKTNCWRWESEYERVNTGLGYK